jgi:hypothetical protein
MYITNRSMLRLLQPKVEIMRTGHFVSRCSDYIIYSVEAKNIDAVVRAFGPCMLSGSSNQLRLTLYSHQGRRHRRRPNLLQSPRDRSL